MDLTSSPLTTGRHATDDEYKAMRVSDPDLDWWLNCKVGDGEPSRHARQ